MFWKPNSIDGDVEMGLVQEATPEAATPSADPTNNANIRAAISRKDRLRFRKLSKPKRQSFERSLTCLGQDFYTGMRARVSIFINRYRRCAAYPEPSPSDRIRKRKPASLSVP